VPQFVRNGPIVPDRLVQDLEDDRVVIFCGAGISMGAGLPSYRGLVEHCYAELGQATPSPRHRDWDWPDRMMGLLESRASPARVREVVAARLSREPGDLAMHRAILALARLRRSDGMRLITTNFDHLFERAGEDMQLGRDFHAGPVLPIPRNDRTASWRSLVYLHGRLGAAPYADLVLSSADFGRAYLTDAWAARFVARLFADFTVLFIGYSLNDPVLRYMTDAFAAEDAEARVARERGPAYIFIPYKGRSLPDRQPFEDRKLDPIFYHEQRNHRLLKQTLVAWAEARSDYLANTTALIRSIAPFRPDAIDPTATANLLWAVAGRSDDGHGARVFARGGEGAQGQADVPPPLEWFDAFEARDGEIEAAHARAVVAAREADRPPPPAPTPTIESLFPLTDDHRPTVLSPVARGLIPWLVRHLGQIDLVDRIIAKLRRGSRLHPQLRQAIRRRLDEAPDLPDGLQRFWRIVSSEGVWTFAHGGEAPGRVATHALPRAPDRAWLKLEIQSALRPVLELDVSLARRIRVPDEAAEEPFGQRFRGVAEGEVKLADEDHLQTLIAAVERQPDPDPFWAALLPDLTNALTAVLDVYAATDQAEPSSDPSAYQRPSIVPHAQNRNHERWTLLFDLIWRAWTFVDAQNGALSRHHVARWRTTPYLAFRRLSLAAMAHSDHFTDDERLELLADD